MRDFSTLLGYSFAKAKQIMAGDTPERIDHFIALISGRFHD